MMQGNGHDEVALLRARIERIERRGRRAWAAWAVCGALAAAGILIGAGEDEGPAWLTARGLSIVDAEGRARLHLGAPLPGADGAASDSSGLLLLDESGAEAASLTLKDSGARMLTVADGDTDRLALVVWASGESGVYVLGPESKPGYRHQIAVDQDGQSYAIMRGSDGEYIHRVGEPGGGTGGQAQAARPAPGAGVMGERFGGAGAGAGGMIPGVGAAGVPGAAGAIGAGARGIPGGLDMPTNPEDLEAWHRQRIEQLDIPEDAKRRLLERMDEARQRATQTPRPGAAQDDRESNEPRTDEDETEPDDDDADGS